MSRSKVKLAKLDSLTETARNLFQCWNAGAPSALTICIVENFARPKRDQAAGRLALLNFQRFSAIKASSSSKRTSLKLSGWKTSTQETMAPCSLRSGTLTNRLDTNTRKTAPTKSVRKSRNKND